MRALRSIGEIVYELRGRICNPRYRIVNLVLGNGGIKVVADYKNTVLSPWRKLRDESLNYIPVVCYEVGPNHSTEELDDAYEFVRKHIRIHKSYALQGSIKSTEVVSDES